MSELKPVTGNQRFLAKMAGMDVSLPKPVTTDQMLMQKIIENGGGGVTSWNDLQDRPFGSEVTEGVFVFDGDINKYETYEANGTIFVKASDRTFFASEVMGLPFRHVTHDQNGNTIVSDYVVTADGVEEAPLEPDGPVAMTNILGGGFQAVASIHTDLSEFGLPPVGTYYIYSDYYGGLYCESASWVTTQVETIKPLDEKYLPEPKLLGEIVLTNENVTKTDYGALAYNEELKMQVKGLFEAVGNKSAFIWARIEIATIVVSDAAAYCIGGASPGYINRLEIGRGSSGLVMYEEGIEVDETVREAIVGGYPMTIKVYAT